MTVEELRTEAAKLGYDIVKRQQRFLPCICGYNRRTHKQGGFTNETILKCKKCGFEVRGNGFVPLGARPKLWNDVILKFNLNTTSEVAK